MLVSNNLEADVLSLFSWNRKEYSYLRYLQMGDLNDLSNVDNFKFDAEK